MFAMVALLFIGAAVPAMATVVYDTALVSPGVYYGTGNSNSNFTVSTNGTVELGLGVINRFIGPVDPGAGSNTYMVSTGTNGGGLALWDYVLSINTRAGGGTQTVSTDGDVYSLTVKDNTTSVSITGNPLLIGDNAENGSSTTHLLALSSVWGAQNAENPGFPGVGLFPNFNPYAADSYTVTLNMVDPTNSANNVSVSENINAQTPEPGSLAMMGGGLLGIGFVLRRRFGQSQRKQ